MRTGMGCKILTLLSESKVGICFLAVVQYSSFMCFKVSCISMRIWCTINDEHYTSVYYVSLHKLVIRIIQENLSMSQVQVWITEYKNSKTSAPCHASCFHISQIYISTLFTKVSCVQWIFCTMLTCYYMQTPVKRHETKQMFEYHRSCYYY